MPSRQVNAFASGGWLPAACGLGGGRFEAATSLTRPQRDYFGGVGVKRDVLRVAAVLDRAESRAAWN